MPCSSEREPPRDKPYCSKRRLAHELLGLARRGGGLAADFAHLQEGVQEVLPGQQPPRQPPRVQRLIVPPPVAVRPGRRLRLGQLLRQLLQRPQPTPHI